MGTLFPDMELGSRYDVKDYLRVWQALKPKHGIIIGGGPDDTEGMMKARLTEVLRAYQGHAIGPRKRAACWPPYPDWELVSRLIAAPAVPQPAVARSVRKQRGHSSFFPSAMPRDLARATT